MDSLYIVMPAYNEQANISQTLEQWYPIVEKTGPGSRLVIIDDGSRDRTYETLQKCQKTRPQLVVLTKENQGHGPTILKGYRYALRHGADYVFQTDSDGQTLPEEFWQLWKDRELGGMLAGDRVHRQDGFLRILVTKVLQVLLGLVFQVWLKDANVPFRLMKGEELKMVLSKVPRDFNLANVLVSVIYARNGLGIHYYPITFRPRQGGKNSINMKKIVKIGLKAVRDFFRLRKQI